MFNNSIFQTIAAVAILALGIWLGTLFSGCNKGHKPATVHAVDTLVIDTSKIIEHTPIIVQNIKLIIHDTLSCEASLHGFVTKDGDTISIGRVNSCKGLLENVSISRKPDTVTYTETEVIRDTVMLPVKFPSYGEMASDLFHFGIIAKAGSGFGMAAGLGLDFNAGYGRVGINVSPSIYYLDKFRGFVFIGATYKIK